MHQSDLTLLPVHALSAAIQARRLSPVDVVEAYFGRIEAHEPKLQAFVDRGRRPTRRASDLPQIVYRSYDEATALRIGWAYQDATDWHIRRPPE